MRTERDAARPLSALLSQALVAFTLEFDNEFERRMNDAGYPGALLSMVVWCNLIRFLANRGMSVHDLAVKALAPEKGAKFGLGCLERWRFVTLQGGAGQADRVPRDGWGSGRGIRSTWLVQLTSKGRTASEIWPPLFDLIEARWRTRFGEEAFSNLHRRLHHVVAQIDLELAHGLPAYRDPGTKYPNRGAIGRDPLPLPVLLSQLLLAFTLDFERESRTPIELCANILRVLGEEPIPESAIPRLTGASPETSGIGWQAKPYIAIEPASDGSRGKLVRLTDRGLRAQQTYRDLTRTIEDRWQTRFGKDNIRQLRESLQELFVMHTGDALLFAQGLIPAEGTVRAGELAPALGRRDIGAAAKQRMRDLVAQTAMFLQDPAETLPHYPLWDMNRGFGP